MTAQEFVEAYAKKICERCADETLDKELFDGRWHSRPGSDSLLRCTAASFRDTAHEILSQPAAGTVEKV